MFSRSETKKTHIQLVYESDSLVVVRIPQMYTEKDAYDVLNDYIKNGYTITSAVSPVTASTSTQIQYTLERN